MEVNANRKLKMRFVAPQEQPSTISTS